MQPEARRVLEIAEQLDPILVERAYLRALNELQGAKIKELNGEDPPAPPPED